MTSTTGNLIAGALHIQQQGIKINGEGSGELEYELMMVTFILNRFLFTKCNGFQITFAYELPNENESETARVNKVDSSKGVIQLI